MLVAAMATKAGIVGHSKVMDHDAIEVTGQRILIYGIDAPESVQTCVAGAEWRYGNEATAAGARMIQTDCEHCSERDRDQYRRVVAVCHMSGSYNPNMSAEMARDGRTMAYCLYPNDYVKQEHEAPTAHGRIWRGTPVALWDWRIAQQARKRSGIARAAIDRSQVQSDGCKKPRETSARGTSRSIASLVAVIAAPRKSTLPGVSVGSVSRPKHNRRFCAGRSGDRSNTL